MELYEMRQTIADSRAKMEQLGSSLDLAGKKEIIAANENKMAQPDFWNDQKKAQSLIRDTNQLKELIRSFEEVSSGLEELAAGVEELGESFDPDLKELLDDEYEQVFKAYGDFEIRVLLSGPYDSHSAILEIHPGAGGTEAMDWAEMLYRMYVRYAERHGYKITVMNYQEGEEAGLKSCSILIEGPMAYGYLKAENGVHRLVRISPFDSNARRHTSFTSVDVMPQFEDDMDIEIDEKDLEVITMRSSGAGGQHINKTDSAVRMTHKPTGSVVFCQSQRSQLQNREACMNMLKSKLLAMKIEENRKRDAEVKGEQKAIEWGSQIRSYVFHPYTMVKDLRTGYEVGNIQAVMDGDLDGFIYSYLRTLI
ncbi:MAG: peptide chain release factor 2 [Solobacterium sp.]|nr:peptide chain release factor 2 [Solobacterium sp.]